MDPFKVTKLYLERVFPFVGLLRKVILDRDLRFTSRVFREICILLKVKQSIASAYHLQTNSQSKKTNLYVETALYIFSNFQQDNWSKLLPLVQYQLNSYIFNTTHQISYKMWMGFISEAYQP